MYKLNSIIIYTIGNELCTFCKLELGELISEGYTVNKCHIVAGQMETIGVSPDLVFQAVSLA